MKKRLTIFTGIAMLGFSFGAMSVSFAEIIPGVDEPYDPTAYYSPTAISWADSAPSPYAVRDLVSNGGRVYDYTRHIKSILFGDTFEKILGVENDKTKLSEKNTENWSNHSIGSTISRTISILKSMGGEHRDKTGTVIGSSDDWSSSSVNENNKKVLERLGKNHMDNLTSYDLSNQVGGLFWGVDMGDEGLGRTKTSEAAQVAWIRKTYNEIGESSKNIASDQQQIIAANEYALSLSSEAEGKVQALIADTMARTVHTQALVDRNELYSKLLQMKSIEWIEKLDNEQHANDIKESFSYHMANPSDENAYKYAKEHYGIEKIQGHGMPDFK